MLNTENSDFSWPGLAVTASRVADKSSRRLTWSEALLACLDRIETELVFYVQEDYFLNDHVEVERIDEFADLMIRENVASIQLTPFGSDGNFLPATHSLLLTVHPKAPYRIALQAALWKRDRLKSYLRSHENAWQFEMLGSIRSRRVPDVFYALDREIFSPNGRQVFPYVKTGIIKGQWFAPAVVELVRAHDIRVDFARRGFFQERSRLIERFRTLALMMSRPADLIRSLRQG